MPALGIDVAGYQAGIDLRRARAEGAEFVIVKAAGYNTGSLYSASGWAQHVDNARAAGLFVGHYYVPGRGSPTEQARHFWGVVSAKFDRDRDVLALDNEPLDANAVFWMQEQAFEFLAEIQRLSGIPWGRLWLYCPAAKVRAHGPWNRITDLPIRIWWAAYGRNGNGKAPDHEPALQGKIARWDVHQFSSNMDIAGHAAIDGDYAKLSTAELFTSTAGTPGGAPAPAPKPGKRLWTGAVNDGDPTNPNGPSIYYTLVQTLGEAAGIYDGRVDGVPGPKTYRAETILLARILNALRLTRAGRVVSSTASETGEPYNGGKATNFSNFVWMGQAAAKARGWYDRATDGLDGPNSRKGRVRLLAEWLNANAPAA